MNPKLLSLFLLIPLTLVVVGITIPYVEAKDFSNVGGSFDCQNVQCSINVLPNEVAEKFEIFGDEVFIQTDFSDQLRTYKAVVGNASGNIHFFNLTVSNMNELGLFFDVSPVGVVDSVEFEVNGTQFDGVNINGADLTLGVNNGEALWVYEEAGGSGVFRNKITIEPTPNNITISLPQDASTVFSTHGRSLEGNFLNNFTAIEFTRIFGLAQHYNLNESNINHIINFTQIDKQRAYEIAGKMNSTLGFFIPDANLTKAGLAYIDGIGNSTTFAEMFDKIEQRIRNETGTGGIGNDPTFGDVPPES